MKFKQCKIKKNVEKMLRYFMHLYNSYFINKSLSYCMILYIKKNYKNDVFIMLSLWNCSGIYEIYTIYIYITLQLFKSVLILNS